MWQNIPEGFYAVPDAADSEQVTYWRMKVSKKGNQSLGSWPTKARYVPVPYRNDERLKGLQQPDFWTLVHSWHWNVGDPYCVTVVEEILENPMTAGQRFADFTVRCCWCGRKLTNELSKVYGVGSECRKYIPADILADYYHPHMRQAHVQQAKPPHGR